MSEMRSKERAIPIGIALEFNDEPRCRVLANLLPSSAATAARRNVLASHLAWTAALRQTTGLSPVVGVGTSPGQIPKDAADSPDQDSRSVQSRRDSPNRCQSN